MCLSRPILFLFVKMLPALPSNTDPYGIDGMDTYEEKA